MMGRMSVDKLIRSHQMAGKVIRRRRTNARRAPFHKPSGAMLRNEASDKDSLKVRCQNVKLFLSEPLVVGKASFHRKGCQCGGTVEV